jgi:hypothetical protein
VTARLPLRIALALSLGLVAACAQEVAWPKTAGDTTCREWTEQMRPLQRKAMGNVILLTLRGNDGNTREPANGLVDAYVTSIGDVCANAPDEKVSAVATTIYGLSDGLNR